MTTGVNALTPWQRLLAHDLSANSNTLVVGGIYALFSEGLQGEVPWILRHMHVKVYSHVYPAPRDVVYTPKLGVEPAPVSGEWVVCLARQNAGRHWAEPRLVPAVVYGLAEPDDVSKRLGRRQKYACVPFERAGEVRSVCGLP